MAKKQRKTDDEILGSPKFEGFSENALRIRRNLILFTALLFFVEFYQLKISSGSFIGMKIDNLDSIVIREILLILTLYSLIHFIFETLDCFFWLRIRVTGTFNFIKAGNWGDPVKDNPDNKNQSSLYRWFYETKNQVSSILDRMENGENLEVSQNSLKTVIKPEYIDDRLTVSLNRFDKWFWSYNRYQILKLLVMDWFMPILVSTLVIIYIL